MSRRVSGRGESLSECESEWGKEWESERERVGRVSERESEWEGVSGRESGESE